MMMMSVCLSVMVALLFSRVNLMNIKLKCYEVECSLWISLSLSITLSRMWLDVLSLSLFCVFCCWSGWLFTVCQSWNLNVIIYCLGWLAYKIVCL